MSDYQALREQMVEYQLARRGIREPVLSAMAQVPREEFVDEYLRGAAYDDGALPIEAGQTISQPFIVALMVQELGVGPDDTVLEIGAGSGYAAAVLSRLVSTVHAVERHEVLVEAARERLARLGYDNAHIHHGDGSLGWPEAAPYDGILVSAATRDLPSALIEQLRPGAALIVPVGGAVMGQELKRLVRQEDQSLNETDLCAVQFVPLREGTE